MDNNEIHAQILALKVTLSVVIRELPDETKNTILKTLQHISEQDYEKMMKSLPGIQLPDEGIKKSATALTQTYKDIISGSEQVSCLYGHPLQ